MAIALMSKMKLVGLRACEDEILNALQKTECVELSEPETVADTFTVTDSEQLSELNNDYGRLLKAIEFYEEQYEEIKTRGGSGENSYHKNFPVSYEEFINVTKDRAKIFETVANAEKHKKRLSEIKSETVKLSNVKNQLLPYTGINCAFSDFKDTAKTNVYFGTIKRDGAEVLAKFAEENDEISFTLLSDSGSDCVICVVALKSFNKELLSKTLNEQGFVKCPFTENKTAKEYFCDIDERLSALETEKNAVSEAACADGEALKGLKLLCDRYKFEIEKSLDAEKFRRTDNAFMLEGFVPKGKEEDVKRALSDVSDAIFTEFSEPCETDVPPTLTVNNAAVRQAEFITDMYSVPDYKEVDPNRSVFFFFMVFMGLIMADVGYGLVMIMLGTILSVKTLKNGGSPRLWNIIAIGGVFTVIFGILFNSFFGFSIYPGQSILPSPVPDGSGTDGLMLVLLGCLALGILHIAVGYFLKAVNCFKNKDVAGGIFDGLVWVLFFVGLVFAAFNFILKYLLSEKGFNEINPEIREFFDVMTVPGIIIVAATVLLAALTAGRKERGFGKFSKGFGAVYGLINIMSDILSYARLFGLLLSGMIIASTFNDIGGKLIAGGGIGYAAGPLVMIAGHAFNLAMGVLGAYIHDSRLQYIEFFSKFYTGEGRKFTPIGSETQYVYITK